MTTVNSSTALLQWLGLSAEQGEREGGTSSSWLPFNAVYSAARQSLNTLWSLPGASSEPPRAHAAATRTEVEPLAPGVAWVVRHGADATSNTSGGGSDAEGDNGDGDEDGSGGSDSDSDAVSVPGSLLSLPDWAAAAGSEQGGGDALDAQDIGQRGLVVRAASCDFLTDYEHSTDLGDLSALHARSRLGGGAPHGHSQSRALTLVARPLGSSSGGNAIPGAALHYALSAQLQAGAFSLLPSVVGGGQRSRVTGLGGNAHRHHHRSSSSHEVSHGGYGRPRAGRQGSAWAPHQQPLHPQHQHQHQHQHSRLTHTHSMLLLSDRPHRHHASGAHGGHGAHNGSGGHAGGARAATALLDNDARHHTHAQLALVTGPSGSASSNGGSNSNGDLNVGFVGFLPEALDVGLYCEKGCRAHNEDCAFAMMLEPSPTSSFAQAVCWGVFDGHGGVDVAEYLTACFPDLVAQRGRHIKEQGAIEVAAIMLSLEQELASRYHEEWAPEGRDPGSTALVATVMDDVLLIANCGDCRLLLISEAVDSLGNRTAYVVKATADHHPHRNPNEAARLASAGALVDEDGYIGSLLEVSRSIGDFHTKQALGSGVIIAEPELYSWALSCEHLLVVAVTDGISGVMDDMEICNYVCKLLNEPKHCNDASYAARELASYAVASKLSSDNCSAVVVLLKGQPPPMPARRRLFGRG
ncbi:hypothetical protein FOA52_006112 [Chlamydomonas sp. UWO 241]|nr:hypothetical protein FOA52_006112 [Chlamydomonas sp. UWO 241]